MVLSIFTVTYASYGDVDGEVFTETKVFLDEDKARAWQKNNIEGILRDEMADEALYEAHKDDDYFNYEGHGWSYSSKLECQDFEFLFNPKK